MRIGIRAHDVKADTFEELVKEIRNQGMHCCQLAVPKAVHEFPTQKEVLTPGAVHEGGLCQESCRCCRSWLLS